VFLGGDILNIELYKTYITKNINDIIASILEKSFLFSQPATSIAFFSKELIDEAILSKSSTLLAWTYSQLILEESFERIDEFSLVIILIIYIL